MRRTLPIILILGCVVLAVVAALRVRRTTTLPSTPTATLPQVVETATPPSNQSAGVSAPLSAVVPTAHVASAANRPVAHLPPKTLPNFIPLICGSGRAKDYHARITAAHSLASNLTQAEIQSLLAVLHQKASSQSDLNADEFAALQNDILDALLRQKTLPQELGREIVAIYRDHSTDPLWRDYCVQHFAAFIGQTMDSTDSGIAADRAEIFRGFQEALQETNSGIAGAALMALYRLAGKVPEADVVAIGDRAVALAADSSCDNHTRIAAVGIGALAGRTEILPVAHDLARNGDVLPLRLASIAAIGALGSQQDIAFLEGLRVGPDANLRKKAIDTAIAKLNQRFPNP